MPPSLVTPAIVLRSRPFGESDRIVSFLTADFGKITGIAKGAMRSRKRFVNSLEPFAQVNLHFQDRAQSGLAFIVAADLVVGYRHLARSLETISHAAYLVEITDGLVGEREESMAVYHHLRDGLRRLEEHGTSFRLLIAFELKLLRLVGYQPVLDNCKRCAHEFPDPEITLWYFSPADGGVLCNSCASVRREALPLGAKAIEILTALQAEPNNLPSSLSLPMSVIKEMRAAIEFFIQFHMVRQIKSAAFLQQFSPAFSATN
ncbi:MAG: DNA repair protein RecO [Deltaproteobacteria bacterium]|nr:DNA repair protein RecO [Deltaproteobacteria bacterium]